MDQPPNVSFQRRFWLLLAVWCVALIAAATAFPHASRPGYALLFPYGLITFVISAVGMRSQDAPHVIYGWLLYLALTLIGLLMRKRFAYVLLYAMLCVMLLLNVIGCHMMFHGYPKT
jgi:hypothetical protein